MYSTKSVIFDTRDSSSSASTEMEIEDIKDFEKTMFICKSDVQLVAHNVVLILYKMYASQIKYSSKYSVWIYFDNDTQQWKMNELNPLTNICKTSLLQYYMKLIKYYTYEITSKNVLIEQLTINDYTNKINQCCAISIELMNDNSELMKYILELSPITFKDDTNVLQFSNLNSNTLFFKDCVYNTKDKKFETTNQQIMNIGCLPYNITDSQDEIEETVTVVETVEVGENENEKEGIDNSNKIDIFTTKEDNQTFLNIFEDIINNNSKRNVYLIKMQNTLVKNEIASINEQLFKILRVVFGTYVKHMLCASIRKNDYEFDSSFTTKVTLFMYDGIDTHYNCEIVNTLLNNTRTIPVVICVNDIKWINMSLMDFNIVNINMNRDIILNMDENGLSNMQKMSSIILSEMVKTDYVKYKELPIVHVD